MPSREQKLQRAVNTLTKYFGLHNAVSLAAAIVNEQQRGTGTVGVGGTGLTTAQQSQLASVEGTSGASESSAEISPDTVMSEIITLMIDTSEGSFTALELARRIARQMENASEETKSRVRQLIQFYGTTDDSFRTIQNPTNPDDLVTVNDMLSYAEGQGATINGNQTSPPSKEKPGLSILFSNSKRVSQVSRHSNAVTIFMNGIPTIEIAKAVPYLNIDFLFARPPVSEDNRLQTPSLLKFLNGADQIPSSNTPGEVKPYRSLALGNQITQEVTVDRQTTQEPFALAGMEMFTSPQTLVNANEVDREENRSNPVLDKFRPFMTIKDFEVNIVGTTGLANYKTGKLTVILHDRSRLADVADFVRPDLYGRTELLIEYGWSHPDGENSSIENPYGDLINGMRCSEKYGVRNSSYTFDEAGQVIITLDLYMRGGVDTSTELISSDDESIGDALRAVEELQQTISEIRQRSFQQGTRTREVRGIQILDAAQDALAHSILSSDLRTELRTFRRTLTTSATTPDVSRLRQSLEDLFGTEQELGASRRSGTTAQGAVGQVRATVLGSVTRKVQRISQYQPDPFLIENYPPGAPTPGSSRQVVGLRGVAARQQTRYRENFGTEVAPGAKASLATLLLHFIGEPLANTRKFDDVQLIFYPFNTRAGYAANLNIGNFEVDLSYFSQEFARLRLANISRSSNMNLREFMNFVGQALLDDPAARSYGLFSTEGAFYREVYEEGNVRSTEAVDEVPRLQQRTQERLRGVTPDGTFDMPQIEFYLECLPEKIATEDGQDSHVGQAKSILRLHIYDRKSTSYESLGSLLASAREGEMAAVGRIPGGQQGNPNVTAASAQDQTAFIETAERYNLIEAIEGTDPPMYRINGGPRKLKKFLYRTMPYMIYGAAGSLIKAANVSSQQNPELATINMLRSFRRSELQPNGELPGGLPMRIIPTELTMQTMGCPLFVYTQQFFVDFQTGTSADNIYGITGLTHKITEGEFSTDVRFAPFDAYGRYDSFVNRVFNARQILASIETEQREAQADGGASAPGGLPTTITRDSGR